MAILQTITLGLPDTAGADTLFEGFTKVNDNTNALGDNTGAETGAAQIGYDDGGSPSDVQTALDAMNATSNVANVGGGQGQIFRDIATGTMNLRTLVPGTNVSFDTTTDPDVIEINSGLANSSEITEVDTFPYDVDDFDEIILVDTGDTAGNTINLPIGTNKRVLTIKNLAWSGTGDSHTSNTVELNIAANTGNWVEDDRTAMPTTTTAIGPGSAMRIAFSGTSNVWSIV